MNQTALKFGGVYPAGFFRWLAENQSIYQEFERQALRMAELGRKRYSARTIVETIRWTSDLSDTDTTFKINDHFTPGMARLWMEEYGWRYPGFFEIRGGLS